ncbi:MAG: restriction endonuclease subunit S [Syntrophomonas sp.]
MMKINFKKYDAYKNSMVEWIGDIPVEWKLIRNKDIFEERGTLSTFGTETLLTISHITGVTRRTEKNVNMFMAETMKGYKLCEKGDLVINTMWAWMGALGTSNENGICSPAYGVYKPKKGVQYSYRYFDYLYRTPNFIIEMTKNSKGIVSSRLRLYPREFFQIKTALPSYETQKAITDYLDTKTAQIDHKIDLLTQKATKYSELKQSLINETVTHGLNKTVAMKDSGVEWIGEVPEDWVLKQFKQISTMKGRIGWQGLKHSEFIDEGPFLITGMNFKGGRINWDDVYHISNERYKQAPEIQLKDNDVLMTKDGTIGKLLYVEDIPAPHKASLNSHLLVLRPIKKSYHPKYIFYQLDSLVFRHYIELVKMGTTFFGISQESVGQYIAVIPPLKEQQAIADYLDNKTAHIDRIIETINTQIHKLRELRKTLINDVVTGKIKVAGEGESA